jgi:hypothetical protein
VNEIALDEINRISSQGFVVPSHELTIIDFYDNIGWTLIHEYRYTIVLKPFYFREAQLRMVVSHEIGHVMLDQAHIVQSEVLADRFAACFGSEKARQWAKDVEAIRVDDCEAFRSKLIVR